MLRLNDDVWVRLSQRGEEHLLKHAEEMKGIMSYGKTATAIVSSRIDNCYKFSLQDFMRIMGPLCNDGYNSPIADNLINISDPNKSLSN